MTIQSIKMPDIGEGIAEVEVVAWRVQVGDVVAEDQILADVMTDKATVEIPSHVAGTVVSLDAVVGQVVAVGTPIIHIEQAIDHVNIAQAAIKIKAEAKEVPDARSTEPIAPQDAQPKPQRQPNARSGDGRDSDSDVATSLKPAAAVPPLAQRLLADGSPLAGTASRPIASPAVRRRAWELGIDLAQVPASGPAGRIFQADLAALTPANAAGTAPAQAPIKSEAASTRPQAPISSEINSYSRNQDERYRPLEAQEVIPVIGLRRKIAQKMQDAKRRIPHFTYVEEIDVTELEDLRARLNTQYGQARGRLTVLPFLMRAMVLAVRDHPEVNARYDDDAGVVTRFAAVHLGLATQTAGGLMVPVIRHAETLDLWAAASAVLKVSDAARNGKATRDDLSGSTLTLTSLGALGGIVSTPVINHPEVAIVGTNRIVERPMIKGGLVVARKMMNLSSSFDHRVVDGMHAAEFIQQMRGYLECPGTLLV
ncbi:MAG: dihydrolipoamide acetyltransferase family protein [Rhodoferax sp.]|uniref:dihydrolipoamide acetyltransferase family protein n=1 Tax=Rhodoferax sp. TaxID=50421 RepID=UPI00262A04C4|nr:dihydrolipoamide acetyltransferase family protein [Rhodoferax sp.]MDD2881936.1 dihydrolipoamide acetyltransferase family protein [Rhodoferax sp.]